MAMTKTEASLLAASQLTSRSVAAVAATYEAWITAQDTEATAILALLAVHRSSKSPARVVVNANARYAAIEADPPFTTSLTPATGGAAGGTAVTLTGHDYTGATGVTFGGVAATSVVVVSDTSITCVTGAHAAGAVSLIVTTPAGSHTKTTAFTYV